MSSFASLFRRSLLVVVSALAMSVGAQSAEAQTRAAGEPTSRVESSGVVNVNTASAEELTRLPGIGASRAQAILELREKVKRFQNVDELMRVKGIGRASLRNLRPMLSLEGPTTLAAKTATKRSTKAASPAAQ